MKRKLSYLQSTSSRICIINRVSWVNPATGRWLTGMLSSKGVLWKWSSILHAPSRNLEDQLKTLKCAHCTNGCQGMVGARPQTTYNNRRQGSRAKEDSHYGITLVSGRDQTHINLKYWWYSIVKSRKDRLLTAGLYWIHTGEPMAIYLQHCILQRWTPVAHLHHLLPLTLW
jgi:hypothetical protein